MKTSKNCEPPSSVGEPVLELEGVTVSLGHEAVLRSVSWKAHAGEFWAVVGPNGAGKTTLLKTILGLIPCAQGCVRLWGVPVARFAQWDRIGYLPQTGGPREAAFPVTVREMIAMGRLPCKRFPRRLAEEDHAAITNIVARLGLHSAEGKRFDELSGGEQQRVLLAQTLVNQPALLLLDEPTLALDPNGREVFYDLLGELRRGHRTTIVLVTHDSATAGRYADHLLYLDREIIFAGSLADFCASPEITAQLGRFAQHIICHQHDVIPMP